MNNLAQELQDHIDKAKSWNAMDNVEKAVDIFVKALKKDLITQAKHGVEIDDMGYVVGSQSFDNIYAAFHQAYKSPHYPTDFQVKKFKNLLRARLLDEGLKFELRKDERTDIITMKFTVHSDSI